MTERSDPPPFTVRQLEIFLAAVQYRELSKVAGYFAITRQAIGEHLKKLARSKEFQGVPLWKASMDGGPLWPFELTPAGHEVLPTIRALVEQAGTTNHTISEQLKPFREDGATQGTVRVGCLEVHLEGPLGILAPYFESIERRIKLDLRFGAVSTAKSEESQDLEELLWKPLRSGRLDVVFGGPPRRDFDHHVLYTATIVAGVADGHALHGRESVDVRELRDYPICMLPAGYFSRERMGRIFQEFGYPAPEFERPTVRGLELLRDGLRFDPAEKEAVDIVPVVADDAIGSIGGVSLFPTVTVDGKPVLLDMCVHWRRSRAPDPLAMRFIEFVKERTPGQGRPWNDLPHQPPWQISRKTQ
jgi:DNA-binding transcriptional LysR family regulator